MGKILLLGLCALFLSGMRGHAQRFPILGPDDSYGQLEVRNEADQVSTKGWVLIITQGSKTPEPWRYRSLSALTAKYPTPDRDHSLRITQRARKRGGYSYYSLADRLRDQKGSRLQVISLPYHHEVEMEHFRRDGRREYIWGFTQPGEPYCVRSIRTEVYARLIGEGQLGITLRRFYKLVRAFRCDNLIGGGNVAAIDWQARLSLKLFEKEGAKIVEGATKQIERQERIVQIVNASPLIIVPASWGVNLATQGMETSPPIYLGSVELIYYRLPKWVVGPRDHDGGVPILPPPPGINDEPPGTPPNPDEHYPTVGDVDGRPMGNPDDLPNANDLPPSLPPSPPSPP